MLARRLFLATAVSLLGVPSMAQDYKLGSLEITTPWTRATAPTARTGGGFMTITNKGATADRLVSARSTASEKVEIHEMQMDGSVMRMRELAKGLDIPPGATVMLKPGSYHIMFMELKAPLAKDAKVPVTLVFEKAGSIDVQLNVQAMGAMPQGHGKN
jgi:hypothetical protein